MALDFPFDAFIQAKQRKDQQRQQMAQNWGQTLASLGQSVGQGVKNYRQAKKKKDDESKMSEAVDTLVKQNQSYSPFAGIMKSDPSTISGLVKSQQPKVAAGTKTIWRNQSGDVSDVEPADKSGWLPYDVKEGQALQIMTNVPHQKAQDEARTQWADAWQKRIKFNQIDMLAKSVSLTPQQKNILQGNNIRANRAINLANQANTWQEFDAIITDAGAVMQGGVPHVDRLHSAAYPSWKQDFARIRTYATSEPTANVPEEFKNRVVGMLQGVQDIDNRYLDKNSQFMQKMLLPTIPGGESLRSPIQDITKQIIEKVPYTGAQNNLNGLTPQEMEEFKRLDAKYGKKR